MCEFLGTILREHEVERRKMRKKRVEGDGGLEGSNVGDVQGQ